MYRDFGNCECGGKLMPIYFVDEEYTVIKGIMTYTGRKKMAVSHLTCEHCLKNECVDDSFDGEWYR
jgi:hypothetical protein